jgi:hypothetical protein
VSDQALLLVATIAASVSAIASAVCAGIQIYQTWRTQKIDLKLNAYVGELAATAEISPPLLVLSVTNCGLREARVTTITGQTIAMKSSETRAVMNVKGLPRSLRPGEAWTEMLDLTRDVLKSPWTELIAFDSIGGKHPLDLAFLYNLNKQLERHRVEQDTVVGEADRSGDRPPPITAEHS